MEITNKCKQCLECIKACPNNAILISNRMPYITNRCTKCGLCIEKCKYDAIKK